ncbi:MAG: hypothetical protein AAB214_21465, partial [Fibrobacterota bacterium]
DGTIIGRRTKVAGEVRVHRRVPVAKAPKVGLYRIDGRKVGASNSVIVTVIGPEGGSIRAPHR